MLHSHDAMQCIHKGIEIDHKTIVFIKCDIIMSTEKWKMKNKKK